MNKSGERLKFVSTILIDFIFYIERRYEIKI